MAQTLTSQAAHADFCRHFTETLATAEEADRWDDEFARRAVEKGYVKPDAVHESRVHQQAMTQSGQGTPRLCEILVEKGFLSVQQSVQVIKEQEPSLALCAKCGRPQILPEAAPGSSPVCVECRQLLEAGKPEEVAPAAQASLGPAVTQLGKYHILRQIGQGSAAVVYEAYDTQLGKRVALKCLRAEGRPEQVKRLEREAMLATELAHPNIVAIHEVGTAPDPMGTFTIHYIAMDYVDGRTFREVLSDPSAGLKEKMRILEEVAIAVGYAHSHGVIHRDIKPGNILVDSRGRVALTDFGLARAGGFATKLTQTQAVLGTPCYMAPEQVRGETEAISARTDVYALGAVLYEILTGQVPFNADNLVGVYAQILNQKPQRPSLRRSDVDPDLEAVCLKALEKDSGSRYGDALEFSRELLRWRIGKPAAAQSAAVVPRQAGPPRRRLVQWSATLTALIALGAGVAFAIWKIGRAGGGNRGEGQAPQTTAKLVEKQQRASPGKGESEALPQILRQEPGKGESKALPQILQQVSGLPGTEQGSREAIRLLDEGLAQAPSHELAWKGWLKRATRNESLKQYEEALRDVEKAAAQAPLKAEVFAKRAAIDYRLKRFPEALAACEEAIRLWDLEDALRGEGEAIGTEPERAWVYFNRAWARAGGGDWEGAIADYSTAKRFDPSNVQYSTCRAYAYCQVGRYQDAFVDAQEAAQLAPGNAQALAARGMVYHWIKRLDKALEDYDEAVQVDPRYPDAFYGRGRVKQDQGDLSGAIADYSKALALRPAYWEAYYYRAVASGTRGDLQSTIRDYGEAIRLNPRYAEAHSSRAWARIRASDWDGAITDFTEAIRLSPQNVWSYHGRAIAWQSKGELSEAALDYERAIRMNPNFAEAYLGRGKLKQSQKQISAAVDDYNKALQVAPSDWPHHDETKRLIRTAGR